MVSIPCQSSPDGLACHMDTVGRAFLRNTPIVGVVAPICLVLVFVLAAVRKFLLRREVRPVELVKVLLCLLGIATGFSVAAVFLLTNPPALCELSPDSLAAIGGVVLIILCGLGINEIATFLSKKPTAANQGGAAPGASQNP